jgi:uncharacterized protein YgiM (DUF1202 family)
MCAGINAPPKSFGYIRKEIAPMKRVVIRSVLLGVVLALLSILPVTALADSAASPAAQDGVNPFATISFPPPIYVLRGEFPIRGSANLPNMSNYFIEFRPINEDVSEPSTASWAPATVPSRRAIQEDVLGVWDTTSVDDGAYELRLTVNVRGGQPVYHVVTPLRVENEPSPFALDGGAAGGAPTAAPIVTTRIPTLGAPAATITPTFDPTPRATITSARGNVRSGDNTAYPVVAQLNQGQTVLILAQSTNGTGWFQVRLPNGTIGWVSPTIVSVSGNLNVVPFVAPPPLPPTPTPNVTPTPAVSANLIAGLANITPFPPVCNQQFVIRFDIANQGTQATFVGGTVTVQDVRTLDNSVQATTSTTFPALGPGVTTTVEMRLTVSTFFNETHRLIITIDPANQVLETSKADNTRIVDYVLQPGACVGGGGSGVNFVAGNLNINAPSVTCNQSFSVTFDVANLGSAASTGNVTVTLQDIRAADGSQQLATSTTLGAIAPGQTVNVTFQLTVSTWFNETHRLVATIDPGNAIGETSEGDNQRIVEYVLQQGGCA